MLPEVFTSCTGCLAAVTCTLLLAVLLLARLRRKPRLPPMPGPALPVIGHLYKLKRNPLEQFKQWRCRYGDVFSFYMGGQLVVVINGFQAIKEAMVKKGDVFSHKPLHFYDVASGIVGRGVICSSGQDWKEQRSVIMSTLRQQGFGTSLLGQRVAEEAVCLAERLDRGVCGRSINVTPLVRVSVSSVICSLLFGTRLQHDDEDLQNLVKLNEDITEYIGSTGMITAFPFVRYLPGDPFKGKKVEEIIKKSMMSVEQKWESLKLQKDGEEDEKDLGLIGAYRKEMCKRRKEGVKTFLDEGSLKKIGFDLFGAGTETTSVTIEWFLLYLVHYPQVQRKVFEEIDREIGTEKTPSMQDRCKLVYLQAAILETQRYANILPLSVPHATGSDVQLGGYEIPKGTMVLPNLGSVLVDPEIWGSDVQSFNPDRFLDSSEKLIHREEWIPFGLGRRSCLGESLATMELFLFLSVLCQRFEFKPVDPSHLPSLEPEFGLTLMPKHFELHVVRRELEK